MKKSCTTLTFYYYFDFKRFLTVIPCLPFPCLKEEAKGGLTPKTSWNCTSWVFCSIRPHTSLKGLLETLTKMLLDSLTSTAIILFQAKGLDKQFTPMADLQKAPFFPAT